MPDGRAGLTEAVEAMCEEIMTGDEAMSAISDVNAANNDVNAANESLNNGDCDAGVMTED